MKRLLLLLLLAVTLSAEAQLYNNEWIDYNKTYYKFKIAVTGLYRIRQSTIASLGLTATNADHFQVWRNGVQIPLYTSVQNAQLGASDYIEFWGEMNDGKPDFPMYREADYQLTSKYSLQTDTAAFFLTVNPAGGNARLDPTVNNVAGNTLPVEPYFIYTEGRYFKDKIHLGRAEIVGDSYTYSSSYDKGEGWSTNDIGTGATYPVYMNNLNVFTGVGAPPAYFKMNLVGNAVHARNFKVKLNTDSITGGDLSYYESARVVQPLNVSQISPGNQVIEIVNMCTDPNDRMVISQVELQYPRQFNFNGAINFNFELPANAAGNYLEIAGFSHGGTPPVLYDLTNGKRYVGDISNPALVKVALLPSAVDRKFVLVNETSGNIADVNFFTQRNFVNYGTAANQGNYLIITSPILAGPSGGSDPVEDYRLYRSSAVGGGYNAKVYLIDQLIDQFGYGINMHPLSVRNFIRWARNTYSSPLKNIFLVGKGVIYTQYQAYQGYAEMARLCLVPTFGYPASDNLMSAEGNSSVPLTPIGRLSVIDRSEITIYLNKVKQYEQLAQSTPSPLIADMAWRKNVVHVTGASDDVTTQILQTANEGFQRIIEDTLYGGKVYSFTKSTSESVQQLNGGKLASLFEEGIGLLTYFGHSSASTLEFNLDNPQNYNNPGRYPVMIVMGCNAGNFYNYNLARFSTKETISEKYVLAPERGSIAFLASTHLGIVHYLDIYNTRTYEAMAFRHYGGTLGEIMHDAIVRVFASTTENDFYARFQCEEFTLHGDPALRPYNFPKPDYVIEEPLVKVSPSFISVAERTFKVNAGFMNIGNAPDKKLVVELKRTFPDLTTEIRRDTVQGTLFQDSIIYELEIKGTRDKGLNKLTITLDPDNAIDEAYETNNTISKDIYIFEDEVRPVYPYNYSIVNEQNPKLIASTANAFAETRNYVLQMDTTELFNSPLRFTTTTNSAGGVFEFNGGLTFTDSTVYYWRVAPIPPFGDTTWNTSSFIYINGPDLGFSQAHLYQHFKSTREKIILDSVSRAWSFVDKNNFIFVRNGVYPFTSPDGAYYHGTINDEEGIINPGCAYNELMVNVINPITMKLWKNTGSQYGSIGNCGARDYNFEFLLNTPASRANIKAFLNLIPSGYYVVIRSNTNPNAAGNNYAAEWKADESTPGAGDTFYQELVNQGFSGIDSFYIPRSFIALYRKDMQAQFPTKWQVSEGIFDGITVSSEIHALDSSGYITSPVFGPAKAWHQLKWRGKSLDANDATDSPIIDVIGVDNAGVETLLFPSVTRSQQDFDISSIPVSQYPFVKLRMKNVDTVYHTAYQLKYWMLTYDPVPEGAIAPNLYFTTKDTVEVGEPFNFGIGFKNISKVAFDSIRVKLTITDKDNHENIVPIPYQKKLQPSDTIRLNVLVQTTSLSGHNTMFINFNPDFAQPEQYLTNNYAFRSLYVRPDSLSPLLDVTFDGQHILNRDIVSSKPAILIKLKDEAKWMMLDDTSYLNVQVKFPDGTLKRISFGNNTDTLQFIPAGQAPNANNTASINFNPYFKQDGEYELIVTGTDRSNNSAGAIQYRVAFQIYNKPMISNMLNYPNPFTTSTAFVFTITGFEIPQNIRIQILTITGKVIREITTNELGTLHIGRNITDFKWDGSDMYGQKVAN
ncbi:MAG: C25 family cysteine peptidase, partial [Chitinophagaceae bacterium]